MERDDFTCRYCRSKDSTLNVHHKIYRKGKDPWDYEDEVFSTLCEQCHESAERVKNDILLKLGVSKKMDADLSFIAMAMFSNPVQLTKWGWVAENLAECIVQHLNIIISTNQNDGAAAGEAIDSIKYACLQVVSNLMDAMSTATGP